MPRHTSEADNAALEKVLLMGASNLERAHHQRPVLPRLRSRRRDRQGLRGAPGAAQRAAARTRKRRQDRRARRGHRPHRAQAMPRVGPRQGLRLHLHRRRDGRHALPRRVADAPRRAARRRQVRQQPLSLFRGYLGAARRGPCLRQVGRVLHIPAPLPRAPRARRPRRVHPRQLQRGLLRRPCPCRRPVADEALQHHPDRGAGARSDARHPQRRRARPPTPPQGPHRAARHRALARVDPPLPGIPGLPRQSHPPAG